MQIVNISYSVKVYEELYIKASKYKGITKRLVPKKIEHGAAFENTFFLGTNYLAYLRR